MFSLSKLFILSSVSAYVGNQRQLLESNNSLPSTYRQSCYPSGTCNIGALTNGLSGLVFEGQEINDLSGQPISSAGDFNGDGYPDFLIGAPDSLGFRGSAYMVFGTNTSNSLGNGLFNLGTIIDGKQGFVLQGSATNDLFGFALKNAGDINNDGLADMVVSAVGASSTSGISYVIFGTTNKTAWGSGVLNVSSLMNGNRGFSLQGGPSDYSGYSLGTGADINGDGISDLIIGSPAFAGLHRGKTYVVFGTNISTAWNGGAFSLNSLMNGQQGFVVQGEIAADLSALAVNTGDINGDGISDLYIGAQNAQATRGKMYTVFGSKNSSTWGTGAVDVISLMDGKRGFSLQGEVTNGYVGFSLTTAGDMNGDGIPELIVGTVRSVNNVATTYVVFGSRNDSAWDNGLININSLMDGQRGFQLLVDAPNTAGGRSVNTLGDINGDGLSDVLIGAPGDSLNTGKGYVIYGSSNNSAWSNGTANLEDLMDGTLGFALQGKAQSDFTAFSVAAVGDFNGDGRPDYIVGARGTSSPLKMNSGSTYLLYGGDTNSTYFSRNELEIGSGDTVLLSQQNLNLESNQANARLGQTLLKVENLTNGYFSFNFAPADRITNFYFENITGNKVQFVHTGVSFAPGYRLRFQKGADSFYSDAEINFLGYHPNLENNELTVNQNQSVTLGNNQLSASDQDNGPSELIFDIDTLKYGHFTVFNPLTNTSRNTTQFTQLDISKRYVQFIHDGTRNVPTYSVAVFDGKSYSARQAAQITFNYAPELNISTSPLIFDQDQGTILSPMDVSATDNETFAGSLILEIKDPTYGHFAYSNNLNSSITSFQQLSLITEVVEFVQNGSDVTPTFAIRVTDGILSSPWKVPAIYLNHKPVVLNTMGEQTVIQGEDISIQLPNNLFKDPDANDTLSFRATLVGGVPLPVELLFTPPNHLTGNLPNVGSYHIKITATDNRVLQASTNFVLRANESNAASYRALTEALSAIGSFSITLLAYLWLRRRIAKHRRDFPLANDIRKTLNLEYFDFSRFDGDTFKTKINELSQELQKDYQQFYTDLTPAERKSFAVCVSEILMARGLVTKSEYAGGLFGIMCCLNVGWPTKLDLKKFEDQSLEISEEAVRVWKKASGYTFLPMKDWENGPSQQDTIYVEIQENKIHYRVIHRGVKRGGNEGYINAKDLDLETLPDFNDLSHYSQKIIEMATQNQDTDPNKALKKWPYHSSNKKEKCTVFFCCAKPASASRFPEAGIALESLKKYEAEDQEQKGQHPSNSHVFFGGRKRLAVIEARLDKLEKKIPSGAPDIEKARPLMGNG
ncbi:MAG: FG-GAP repeat protein [Legionella sp.]|nr:FG-GAP repeat protein [Legionella sp.]